MGMRGYDKNFFVRAQKEIHKAVEVEGKAHLLCVSVLGFHHLLSHQSRIISCGVRFLNPI